MGSHHKLLYPRPYKMSIFSRVVIKAIILFYRTTSFYVKNVFFRKSKYTYLRKNSNQKSIF